MGGGLCGSGKERSGERRRKGVFSFRAGRMSDENPPSLLLGRQSSTSEFGGVGYLCVRLV